MADEIGFDFSDISKLAADLTQAGENVGPRARSAVGRTAQRVRDNWRGKASGAKALPGLASKISYTIGSEAGVLGGGFSGGVGAEIGPENGGQGSFGHIHEYGSPTSPPHGFGHAALQEEEEDFVRGIQRAGDDAMKDAGL